MNAPPPLALDRILAELERRDAVCPVHLSGETDSTNDDARAAGGPHGTVFLADHQRAGRGRRGRRWHSPPGENLYCSMLLHPDLSPERLAPLALVAGVAVARVVDEALGRTAAQIKWPNDVLVDGGKIAGVLVESALAPGRPPTCVVGVGLNVLTADFPADPSYALPPTSLRLAGATELDRETLAAALIASLRRLCDDYAAEGLAVVHDELVARDALRGRTVATDALEGVAAGIDALGRLLIEADGVRHPVVSGEIRLRSFSEGAGAEG